LSPFAVDPLLVAELKTAMYSFCGPLQVGALLAHAPASASVHLDRPLRPGFLASARADGVWGRVVGRRP
jgi:hypothetical protein